MLPQVMKLGGSLGVAKRRNYPLLAIRFHYSSRSTHHTVLFSAKLILTTFSLLIASLLTLKHRIRIPGKEYPHYQKQKYIMVSSEDSLSVLTMISLFSIEYSFRYPECKPTFLAKVLITHLSWLKPGLRLLLSSYKIILQFNQFYISNTRQHIQAQCDHAILDYK